MNYRKFPVLIVSISIALSCSGQITRHYWNIDIPLISYRLPPDSAGRIKYLDLDKDGDPDVLQTFTRKNTPVQWIDDDDNMKNGDQEGDLVNDCLMIDRDKDGKYGSYNDLVIDWNDSNNDGKADMQVVASYVSKSSKNAWGPGHYMWVLDTDLDNIFNYIDWDTFELRCWIHNGMSDFFEDYHGKSIFMKMHTTTDKMNDVRLNWENPFLFFDPDKDGLTEMTVRLSDDPPYNKDRSLPNTIENNKLTGSINWAALSFDLDNDNGQGNEFDLDMTINFMGLGFNYMDQVHHFQNMRGLPTSDTMFMDPRWRELSELVYADHESAWDLIFDRGKWDKVFFVFDEDDDCNRWERVELYEPKDPFKEGRGKGGIDDSYQSDAAGDRGEWDLDNSGKGNLYVGRFDGRIHLFGAEWGCWRIDQNAFSFQGFGGVYDGYGPTRNSFEPKIFSTIKYSDSDGNGFFDKFEYDLDGDTIFEHKISLKELGIDDRCEIINTSGMKYDGLAALQKSVSENMWKKAEEAMDVARKRGLNPGWYSLMMSPESLHQKYSYGYWLQFYLYQDLLDQAYRKGDKKLANRINKAYLQQDWKGILPDPK